jgi:hypothetical protein
MVLVASIVPVVSQAVEMDVDSLLAFSSRVEVAVAPLSFAVRVGEVSLGNYDAFDLSSELVNATARRVMPAIENVRDGGRRLSDGTELLALQTAAVDELAAAAMLGGG